MRHGMIFVGLAFAITLSGCTQPIHDEETLAAVKLEASTLLQASQASTGLSIPNNRWPRAIASLKPEAVSVDQAGVDILVKPGFDGGYGYFVLREGERLPAPTQRYSRLTDGIYWYRPH